MARGAGADLPYPGGTDQGPAGELWPICQVDYGTLEEESEIPRRHREEGEMTSRSTLTDEKEDEGTPSAAAEEEIRDSTRKEKRSENRHHRHTTRKQPRDDRGGERRAEATRRSVAQPGM
ncbi:hypothetical protein NDU88_004768 [Pleurodeles waltl]|uniref:Uncharacterized protein n=1 Tax=Pleurodeles waltl TaxID=8319 RepID=A0AAV7QCX3_PLEWA|nr:hypothetical protein NDU88_004768 [Pleurodeles waltl]